MWILDEFIVFRLLFGGALACTMDFVARCLWLVAELLRS